VAETSGPPFRRVLFFGPLTAPIASLVARDGVECRPFRPGTWAVGPDEVAVLVADRLMSPSLAVPPPPGFGEGADRLAIVRVGDGGTAPDPFWSARLLFTLPDAVAQPHLTTAIRAALRTIEERARAVRDRRSLLARQSEIQALVEVGIALSAETDREKLLATILSRARALTGAEGGSLYLVEPQGESEVLRFALAQNDAIAAPFAETALPLDDASIAGFVARTGLALNLPDARSLPAEAPYRFDPGFDQRHGYRTRSVLAVPLRTLDGRVTGVLQLINRKRLVLPDGAITAYIRAEVVPFDSSNEEVARSLAAQAAVALENRRLTEAIGSLFEGFVEAAVTAIEQRDPTTSGHSQRVARLTCALAEATDRTDTGPYAGLAIGREEMRELRYAAVLHDFGKVGVREDVLLKARKLSPGAFALLRARFDEAFLAAAAELWERSARGELPASAAEAALEERRRALSRGWQAVVRANEPSVLRRETGEELAALSGLAFRDSSGTLTPLLAPEELASLSVSLGSLTPEERTEIESHVSQTYRFLAKIPWTRDLSRVAHWAYGHHEKLDGSGYPRRLTAEAIPPPVRMLTICDIFDALAARDRPYKSAVPAERAVEILAEEARRGTIDAELLRIFLEAGVWRATLA
jgi:HD-GYP domain-containing protein (c-di-GMP phosphodiesterase class II)